MFWMGPGARRGLFMLPGIAGLAIGALLLSGSPWQEGMPDLRSFMEEKKPVVLAYVDGKPVKSYVEEIKA